MKLASDWWTDGNYSHGFFIIPIAAYLAWERRDRFFAAPQRPSSLGLIVIVGSILVLAGGVLGSELFLTRISILGTAVGIVLFFFGWARLRVLAFPMAFLFLMIPLPAIIFNQIAFPLQLLASKFGESTLNVVEIPVLREGNVLILANTSLEVAEACSGIRSLISLLTLGIVFGYFADSRGWVRTLHRALVDSGRHRRERRARGRNRDRRALHRAGGRRRFLSRVLRLDHLRRGVLHDAGDSARHPLLSPLHRGRETERRRRRRRRSDVGSGDSSCLRVWPAAPA